MRSSPRVARTPLISDRDIGFVLGTNVRLVILFVPGSTTGNGAEGFVTPRTGAPSRASLGSCIVQLRYSARRNPPSTQAMGPNTPHSRGCRLAHSSQQSIGGAEA